MTSAPRTLGPGWRCEGCGYLLEGLADSAAGTRCPECGHIGQPVGQETPPTVASALFGALVSVGSFAAAWLALAGVWWLTRSEATGAEVAVGGMLMLGVAVALLDMALVAWRTPTRRWPAIAWIGIAAPVAIAVIAATWLLRSGDLVFLGVLAFAIIGLTLLVHFELERRWREGRPGGTVGK